MRVLATIAMAFGVSLSSMAAWQDAAPPGQGRRPRIQAELSDLLLHSPFEACGASGRGSAAPTRLRIATWNIRAGLSAPVDALAAELRAMQADIVGLQEVDVRARRSGFVDEPGALATALGFHYVFAAAIKWDEGDYGLAVLSRWPLVAARKHRLESTIAGEPRIALEVEVCAAGRPLRLFNHHADRRPATRASGFEELRAIVQPYIGNGMLLIGDLNEYPDGPGLRAFIDAGLVDMGAREPDDTAGSGRIDYLLADSPLARAMSATTVWPTDKSDHHAILADLDW